MSVSGKNMSKSSKKGYILVEGHGEVEAAHNLITRLSRDVGLHLPWATPRRWKNLHQWEARRVGGIQAGAEAMARRVLGNSGSGNPIAAARSVWHCSVGLLSPVVYMSCAHRNPGSGWPSGVVVVYFPA